ncbi:unnamed protein product [Candidula unifasciata]|uniref:Uncharacterized protein n=1 Tax=Candidula unifasciata TaxID=100452 RepID=A0A8S3YGV4_9EUPU|nr:unnamed protein product [Candidula unifasciata]
MTPLYLTSYLVLAVFVFYSSASYYNCENGVYDTLYHLTEECRQASYTPYLRELRKKQKQVSGQDIANMLEGYCRVANDTTICVEDYVSKLPCLTQEMEPFRVMNRRSNWYCNEDKVKDVIKDIYNNLPEEALNYRTNQCYKEAPITAYPCIKRYLNVKKPPKDKRETMKKILSSFRCTYRKLLRKCSRSTALMLTTLEYDWLLIPPALGINVSDTLLTVARIKV